MSPPASALPEGCLPPHEYSSATEPVLFVWVLFCFLKYLFIYLAVSGPSWGTWDLSLWHLGARACRLSCPVAQWDLSSPARDQTCVPCIGRHILNHWTTREVPGFCFPRGAYGLVLIWNTFSSDHWGLTFAWGWSYGHYTMKNKGSWIILW